MSDEEKRIDLLHRTAVLLRPLVREWRTKGKPKAQAYILGREYITLVEAVMLECEYLAPKPPDEEDGARCNMT